MLQRIAKAFRAAWRVLADDPRAARPDTRPMVLGRPLGLPPDGPAPSPRHCVHGLAFWPPSCPDGAAVYRCPECSRQASLELRARAARAAQLEDRRTLEEPPGSLFGGIDPALSVLDQALGWTPRGCTGEPPEGLK